MKKKTYITKPKDIKRGWHLFDAKGQILGRMASEIAQKLIGKDKVYYTPHLDCGDHVVVINAADVEVTGRKEKQKEYIRHSGYPGGLKRISYQEQKERDVRKIIEWAVKNMLPKNKLRSKRMNRLRVFKGSEHDYKDKFKVENVKKEK
jgi:large subunit ribosomal protein L13